MNRSTSFVLKGATLYLHRIARTIFDTLQIPLIGGRTFTQEEVRRNADVAVVTDNLTARFWPGQDPIGKRIRRGSSSWLSIVGVVRELKYRGLHRQLFCLPWPRSVHRQVRNGAVEVKLYLTVLRLARQRLARTSVHVY
jgi:hypothetical protein